MIKLSAFRWVPPFAQGLVREMRVRWALEEAGLPYEEYLIGLEDRDSKDYRAMQPFGQVPAFQEDDLVLFESGAIVLHIAERSEVLMPRDPKGRARTQAWMFAALNTIEPSIAQLADIDLFHKDADWTKERRPGVAKSVDKRLTALAAWLGDRDYLEDRFTAGDLLMTTVLRILRHTDILQQMPTLESYCQRCEARPAYKKAMKDHMALFAQQPARN